MTVLRLDYETFSEIDLVKLGLDIYSAHPSTRVLMAQYQIDDGPLTPWEAHRAPVPAELKDALLDPAVIKWAFNSAFERVVTRRVLKIKTPYRGWRCTMSLAYLQSFKGGLDEVGEQMGLADEVKKDKEGKRLIRLFSMPQRVTKTQPHTIRDWRTDPEDWRKFLDYCGQDVVAERAIWERLRKFPIPESEWDLYELDQRINDRGKPVDMQFARNAIAMAAKRQEQLVAQMREKTRLANPNSVQQLLPWLREHGYPFPDLNKDTVAKVLRENTKDNSVTPDAVIDQECVDVLLLRQWAARLSIKKYNTLVDTTGAGDRARFLFQFAGASRTGRWAGRRVQTQNLPRTPKSIDADDDGGDKLRVVTQMIHDGDYDALDLSFSEPMEALVGCVRSAFGTKPGKKMISADLASIESAVIGWLFDCKRLLRVFRDKLDPYRDFGTEMFKKPYDQITKAERNICKPPVLGCFGEDTLVLTDRGWKRIVEVNSTDQVHDGVEFVRHEGVVDQGVKRVIDMHGVVVTPDHEILCGEEWTPAWVVSRNTHYAERAIASVCGPSLVTLDGQRSVGLFTTSAGVAGAGLKKRSMRRTSNGDAVVLATHARRQREAQRSLRSTTGLTRPETSSTGWQIGITPFCLAAEAPAPLRIGTPAGASNVGLPTSMILSPTVRLSLAAARQVCRLIALTMTGTTSAATSASCPRNGTTGTRLRRSIRGLSMADNGLSRPSFTSGIAHSIGTSRRFAARSEKVYPRSKSLMNKSAAEARVYDLVNCGPRHRFVIWTVLGPMIVHNCGYRLGGGDLRNGRRTGLWGYAENMGVEMTQAQAHAAVKVFRENYPEIVEGWYALEKAVKKAMTSNGPVRVGKVAFERLKPYMTVVLPSGRRIYYYQPRIETRTVYTGKYVERPSRGEFLDGAPKGEPVMVEESYVREVFTYMGQSQDTGMWTRLENHGGRWAEQLTQATAREVLAYQMMRAHKDGFRLVAHIHDEAVAEHDDRDNYFTLDRFIAHMKAPIPFAPGLPLGAAGWEGTFYRK